MKNTVVAGGGVLGSQIAFQSAYCGCAVTIWLRSEGSIGRTQPKLEHLRKTYLDTIDATADASGAAGWACGIADAEQFDPDACRARVEAAFASLRLELDLKKR